MSRPLELYIDLRRGLYHDYELRFVIKSNEGIKSKSFDISINGDQEDYFKTFIGDYGRIEKPMYCHKETSCGE